MLAEQFEEHRPHLRAVAYRMLGSLSEADDAVQETWVRLSRTDASEIENLAGWLTTVAARVLPQHAPVAEDPARGAVRRPRARPDREPARRARPRAAGGARRLGRARAARRARHAGARRAARVRAARHVRRAVRGHRPDRRALPERRPAARQPGPPPCAGRAPAPMPTWPASGRWSTRSSRPLAAATSTRSSRCSIPMSSCGPTAAPPDTMPVLVRGAEGGGRSRPRTFARPEAWPTGARERRAGARRAPGGRPFAVMAFSVVGGRIVAINVLDRPGAARATSTSPISRTDPLLLTPGPAGRR